MPTPPLPEDDPAAPRTPTRARRAGWLERLLGGLTSLSSGTAPRETASPERIGRYLILHKLGQGGMGIVYAAEDPSLGRRVALKTIAHPDEESRMRFRREARAAASVNHPHACQIFEIGEDTGRLFIAMELLEGEPLSERLKRGPLALGEALLLGREMLSALSALHAQGVVHRDDTLARHPWIAPIRGEPGFADVLRRAEQARERAKGAFREAGGATLLGLDATNLRP